MHYLHVTPPEDDSYWERVYGESLTNATDWLLTAKSIRLAVDQIAQSLTPAWRSMFESSIGGKGIEHPPEIKMHSIMLMLASYAAENYLKARIVLLNGWTPESIGDGLPKPLKSHNIVNLAALAHADLNEEEIDLADRLSEYAIWAGRYPAPIAKKDLLPKKVGSAMVRATFLRGSDVSVAQCLLQKLDEWVVSGVMPNIERRRSLGDLIIIQQNVRPW
jgi:hypothetical protein